MSNEINLETLNAEIAELKNSNTELINKFQKVLENDKPAEEVVISNATVNTFGQDLWKVYSNNVEVTIKNTVGTEGNATYGANVAPTLPGNSLYQSPNEYGLARRICNVVPVNGKAQDFYTATDQTGYNITENGSISGTSFALSKVTLTPTKFAGIYAFSKELGQDAVIDLAGEARKNFVKVLNGLEDTLLVTRLEALPVANGLTASATGAISASVTSLDIFPQIISVVESNNAAFENGAFLMHPSVKWYFYRLKKTTQDPMIDFNTATQMLYIYGKPVYTTNKLASVTETTAGKCVIAYGDFTKAYFGDRGVTTFEMSTDGTVDSVSLYQNDLVGLKAVERVDIQFIDKNAFCQYCLKA